MGLAVEQCLENQNEFFRKHGRSPRRLMSLCRGARRKIRSIKSESRRHGDAAARGLPCAIREITGAEASACAQMVAKFLTAAGAARDCVSPFLQGSTLTRAAWIGTRTSTRDLGRRCAAATGGSPGGSCGSTACSSRRVRPSRRAPNCRRAPPSRHGDPSRRARNRPHQNTAVSCIGRSAGLLCMRHPRTLEGPPFLTVRPRGGASDEKGQTQ